MKIKAAPRKKKTKDSFFSLWEEPKARGRLPQLSKHARRNRWESEAIRRFRLWDERYAMQS